MGGAVFPPCSLAWGQRTVRVMATSLKRTYASTPLPPELLYSVPQPHGRLLETHRQVWLSPLWDHCSFLLGPGAFKVLFVPSKSLFPQSCASSLIKSHWTSKSNPLGVLSPFAGSPGWEICCCWLTVFHVHSNVIQFYKYTCIIFEIIFYHRYWLSSLCYTVNLCSLLYIHF